MKQTRTLMGMHVTIEIVDEDVTKQAIDSVYEYFTHIDNTFSTYKKNSEISRFNRGEINKIQLSKEVREILQLAEDTKIETKGYFNIKTKKGVDPSGIVKGWAILNASLLIKKMGYENYYVDAGGDIQVAGKNLKGGLWRIGIKNPFQQEEIVKVLLVTDRGVATSGTYIRGEHIYNPHAKQKEIKDIVSMTVVGPDIYDADRFATAAFAMGKKGILFIENLDGFEGYMIDKAGTATMTQGFEKYTQRNM